MRPDRMRRDRMHRRPRPRPSEVAEHGPLLHRPPHLRLGHRHRHHARRRLVDLSLPVAQYPSIAPPTIAINANYPGASAKTVQDSVTQIIEQKMTGLDDLLT